MAATKKAGAKKAAAKKGGAAKKGAAAKKGGATKSAAKKSSGGGAAKSAAKKSSGAGAAKKATKRAPNPAFMKAMTPSADLAAVVGNKPMPRTEVTKKLWEYIRKNNLQDAKNRRQINADDKLRTVFGGKKNVTMFELTKLVNQHLSEG
jgi:upstream activation factor subunit UAF30